MKSATWFDLLLPNKPWRPGKLRWMMQDLAGTARQPEQDPRTHLRATLEWLCRAQDACPTAPGSGWVSSGWSFESGWLPGSIDTTGWLVETYLPAADYLVWPLLENRARAMLDVLLAQPDGTSLGRIHGLIAGHVQLEHANCLERAVRSAHTLLEAPLVSVVHHAQAAHTLAALGILANDTVLSQAAQKYLDAVRSRQTPCGWFAGVSAPRPTTLKELTGTLRSLIELAVILKDQRALEAAHRTAHALRERLCGDGWLAGAYDDGWMPAASHVCMSGLAQLITCWVRLSQLESGATWNDAVWRALAWIKRNQRTESDDLATRDALPSTVPIWRGPDAFSFESMNAKYFADALMMDRVGITIPSAVRKKNQ
ncbi:MAG: hypothetical protein GZ085_04430 [Sulfuriferula multivorans]|uniref:Squalene cyclase C-terminal domain-containing protein n=1 Tax=Sulfuriferula multivorans TaxID=1559896 RepID=A0A7C9K9I3_9PROT|nr:hypothetical protein [Sulfuriferula multivorans]